MEQKGMDEVEVRGYFCVSQFKRIYSGKQYTYQNRYVYYSSITFCNYCKKEGIREVFLDVEDGKLYVNRKGTGLRSHISLDFVSRRIVLWVPRELFHKIRPIDEKHLKLGFIGFPSEALKKLSPVEASRRGNAALKTSVKKKYGSFNEYCRMLAKKSQLKRRKFDSIFEYELIRATLLEGVPAVILQPEIVGVAGIPDILLPGKIVIEFVGLSTLYYVQRLKRKKRELKSRGYNVIIVARSRKVKNELLKHSVDSISKRKYLQWMRKYSRQAQKLMPSLAHPLLGLPQVQ